MITTTAGETEQQGSLSLETSPQIVLLVLAVLAALLVGLLYLAARAESPYQQIARYLCIIPVGVAAYRRRGLLPGLGLAAFYDVLFFWQMVWKWRSSGPSVTTLELLAPILFLPLFAYVVANIASSLGAQRSLTEAVRHGRELLSHASDLPRLVSLIQRQAEQITGAKDSALLLLNPIDGSWEMISSGQRIVLPEISESQPRNLVEWLLNRGEPTILNDLEHDPRFDHPIMVSAQAPRSVLAQPLRQSDGTLVAVLLLEDRRHGAFRQEHLMALHSLVAGAEKALEQAGRYVRTDQALARRAQQLSALQRAARELNATWEPRQIGALTADAALKMTNASIALVGLDVPDDGLVWATAGTRWLGGDIASVIRAAVSLPDAILTPPQETDVPVVATSTRSRLLVPIRRSKETLGTVILESAEQGAFDGQDLEAVTALCDHAAIALENAHLFANVQRERQRTDQIIERMTDGLLTVDQAGHIVTMNPAAQALTGWTLEQAAGRTLCDILDCREGEARCRDCRLATAIREQEVFQQDGWPLRTRAGTRRVLSISAAPLPEVIRGGGGLVVLLRDVTEKEQLERFQRELIAAFSHELRAPLTNISTLIDVLLASEANGAVLQGLSQEHLEMLRAQSRRLASFAERTLDVSRLDTGHWQLEPRPLPAVLILEEAAREWGSLAPEHSIRLDGPSRPVWVWADEHGVATVLANLIDNAVKYSPAGSEIVLSVEPQPPGYATFAVRDRGIGIAPEHVSRIFDRFYRVDGSDAQHVYGHGLGLYTSQRLVEAMGGEIWVTTEPGAGSCFAFTLPIMQEKHLENPDH